jgi:asparagine synthase (glutamine-hydrolysing)
VRTFSVGFDGDPDSELPHARAVARHLGTEHHELVLGPACLALLPGIVGAMDEPFADNSILPTSCLARFARESVTVALSGDGGDEAFLGYGTYARAERRARADALPLALRRGLGGIASRAGASRGLRELGLDPAQRHLDGMAAFTAPELLRLLSPALRAEACDPYAHEREFYDRARPGLGRTGALAALDVRSYLVDDILVKVDRASMRHGLEVRSPLLDRRVIEFALRLPSRMKARDGITKRPLRALVRSRLPDAIVERTKRGFSIPVERWYEQGLRALTREVVLDGRARARGWLDPVAIERLLAPAERPGGRAAAQAFTLLSLELWAQARLDRPRAAALELEDECPVRVG